MAQNLWTRLVRRLTQSAESTEKMADPSAVTLEDVHFAIGEEFRGVRRMLRKQGSAVEALLSRQGSPRAEETLRTGDTLLQLAVGFFHLHQSLRGLVADSPAHREAIALFWLQLERALAEIDYQIIREQGVPFDARLHRAVLSRGSGAVKWIVDEVLEPGFMYGGAVRTPAKVILAPWATEQNRKEDCQ